MTPFLPKPFCNQLELLASRASLGISLPLAWIAAIPLRIWDGTGEQTSANELIAHGTLTHFRPTIEDKETMTVYVIADIKVTDDGWVPAYAAAVHEIVHKHGGKYLARSGNVKTLEGKPRDTTLIAHVQFPSAEAVEAFATDPDYARYAAARQAGSESRLQLIDDTDLAGTIPYLPKG